MDRHIIQTKKILTAFFKPRQTHFKRRIKDVGSVRYLIYNVSGNLKQFLNRGVLDRTRHLSLSGCVDACCEPSAVLHQERRSL